MNNNNNTINIEIESDSDSTILYDYDPNDKSDVLLVENNNGTISKLYGREKELHFIHHEVLKTLNKINDLKLKLNNLYHRADELIEEINSNEENSHLTNENESSDFLRRIRRLSRSQNINRDRRSVYYQYRRSYISNRRH